MEFGNTLKDVRQAVLVGFAIGGIATIIGIVGIYFDSSLRLERPEFLIFVLLCPAFFIFLGSFPTLLFHIRTRNGRVEHVFVGRFVLSSLPIERFLTIRLTGIGPALLFEGGAKIRFYGATGHNIRIMAKHLRAQAAAARTAPHSPGP